MADHIDARRTLFRTSLLRQLKGRGKKDTIKKPVFTRIQIPENFSPDINDAVRPEPQGMFKAIAEQNKLSGGLFEAARTEVNKSFKEPREAQATNINMAQKTLPTFSEIIKRLFGVF